MKNRIFTFSIAAALCIALLAACGGRGSSSSASSDGGSGNYTISIAHVTAENGQIHAMSLAFKEYVEANSDGAITVNIYPNGQMGGDLEVMEAIQNNEITMTSSANAPQANFVTDAFILDIPFTFANLEAMRYTLNDPIFVDTMRNSYRNAGYHLLGYADQDFRIMSTKTPVRSPADVQGMSVRTMENRFHMEAWRALGANPTPISFTELYTALQQGTVDAQENPAELIFTQRFYEQQNYLVLTNHIAMATPWVMSLAFYESLPADLQRVVDDAFEVICDVGEQFLADNDRLGAMAAYGIEIIELSPEELQPFADATASVEEQIRQEVAPEVYNAFITSISNYRAQNQ